jgi:kynurenine formamidase
VDVGWSTASVVPAISAVSVGYKRHAPGYYKDLADRFAEVRLDAVAIDFVVRTAPKRARLAECHRQWLTSPTGEGRHFQRRYGNAGRRYLPTTGACS